MTDAIKVKMQSHTVTCMLINRKTIKIDNKCILCQSACCWKVHNKLGFDVPTTTAEIYTNHYNAY